MRFTHTRLLAVALLLIMMASTSYADISNTAVLFLRIAPGARAAGMGEAFVALADDATATHYNPAGLGAYPLAENWVSVKIPSEYQPIRGLAALKTRGGDNYLAYDIWALTPKGLMRYDNKRWYSGEVFGTKTDDRVEQITARYFGISDAEQLKLAVAKVAAANNAGSLESVQQFRDSVLANIPADYKDKDSLTVKLDSLVAAYLDCRISWDRLKEAQGYYNEGKKNGKLTSRDAERIQFAVERARMRFIPEEVTLPYTAKLQGEPLVIVSNEKDLYIGTTAGLVRYNGRSWQTFATEAGLPGDTVISLKPLGTTVFVGTTNGLARFNGLTVERADSTAAMPQGRVTAFGGSNANDAFAVVGTDLYHFDGKVWSNTMPYTVVIDDSPEKIAAKFSLYGTPAEKQVYLAKLKTANPGLDGGSPAPAPEDSTGTAQPTQPTGFAPGAVIRVPYVSAIKGQVTSVATGFGKTVWLGTSYGVACLDKDGWQMPGYKTIAIDSAASVDALVAMRKDMSGTSPDAYAAALRDINDIGDGPMSTDVTYRVYKSPAAAPVQEMVPYEGRLAVATSAGLLSYNGKEWSRYDLQGLGTSDARDISLAKDELWAASDRRVVMRAKGRPEISMMYVKWLPELADDLYFAYFSFVKPTNSWGTFGASVAYVSYGSIQRTDDLGNPDGTFDAFDVAVTGSYGTSLSNRLKGGISAKFLYSHLSEVGAGYEQGAGTASGFGIDFGLLYHMSSRMNLGMALTNLGPKMSYIDANQADDLPRNLSLGFAYKVINSDYNRLTFTAEANKIMVGLGDGFKTELQQVILNTGAEFTYANMVSLRGGYVYDDEGDVKVATIGFGLALFDKFKFDVAYIPSGQSVALSNVARWSFSYLL